MFDAYTVKKMLPRVVIAIIGIQLSWFLFTEVIRLVNLVAYGIEGIIYQPFGGAQLLSLENILSNSTGKGNSGFFFAAIAAGTVGGILLAVSLGGVLSLAITCMLALFIGFVMLMLRKIIIVFMLILSPLALVAWILPGTEKYFKLWWETFFKLLLLYPMILGVVAAGRVFAWVAATNGSNNVAVISNISQLLIIVVGCFGPFFLIPKLFQLAGSTFANISGAVNNRSKGAFDRLRNRRQQTQKQNWEDLKAGNRFHGGTDNNLRGRLNRGLRGATMASKAGLNPRNWRGNYTSASSTETFNQANKLLQEDEDFAAIKDVDHMLDAARTQTTRQGIENAIRGAHQANIAAGGAGLYSDEADLAQQVASVQRVQRKASMDAVRAASTMALSGTGTGFETSGDMLEAINMAAGNDRGLANRMLGQMRGMASQSRRPDLAQPGMVPMMEELNAMHVNPQGHNADQATLRLQQNALTTSGAHAVLAGRRQAVEPLTQQLAQDYHAAVAGGDIHGATEAAAQITALRGAMGSASAENRQLVTDLLQNVGIDPGAINPETNQPYSVDEQLGILLEGGVVGGDAGPAIGPPTPAQQAQREALERARTRTQEVRTRAGAYDVGGGHRTPQELQMTRPPDET